MNGIRPPPTTSSRLGACRKTSPVPPVAPGFLQVARVTSASRAVRAARAPAECILFGINRAALPRSALSSSGMPPRAFRRMRRLATMSTRILPRGCTSPSSTTTAPIRSMSTVSRMELPPLRTPFRTAIFSAVAARARRPLFMAGWTSCASARSHQASFRRPICCSGRRVPTSLPNRSR